MPGPHRCAVSRRRRVGRPRKRRRNYKREYQMSKNETKQPVGAPIGSQNGLSHGIVAFKNQVQRRVRKGRSLIDRRTRAGQNALALRDTLLDKWAKVYGGAENVPHEKLVLIEEACRVTYFLDEIDRRNFKVIYWAVGKQRKQERRGCRLGHATPGR